MPEHITENCGFARANHDHSIIAFYTHSMNTPYHMQPAWIRDMRLESDSDWLTPVNEQSLKYRVLLEEGYFYVMGPRFNLPLKFTRLGFEATYTWIPGYEYGCMHSTGPGLQVLIENGRIKAIQKPIQPFDPNTVSIAPHLLNPVPTAADLKPFDRALDHTHVIGAPGGIPTPAPLSLTSDVFIPLDQNDMDRVRGQNLQMNEILTQIHKENNQDISAGISTVDDTPAPVVDTRFNGEQWHAIRTLDSFDDMKVFMHKHGYRVFSKEDMQIHRKAIQISFESDIDDVAKKIILALDDRLQTLPNELFSTLMSFLHENTSNDKSLTSLFRERIQDMKDGLAKQIQAAANFEDSEGAGSSFREVAETQGQSSGEEAVADSARNEKSPSIIGDNDGPYSSH